jgi:hypothetical protein
MRLPPDWWHQVRRLTVPVRRFDRNITGAKRSVFEY